MASDLAVLIAESNADLRRNLQEVLELRYPNLTAVGDADEGLDALRVSHVDVLVADVSDPGMGGMALLREAVARHHELMAVAIVEAGDTHRALEAIKLGVYQCLSRPLEARSLASAVDGAADELSKRHSSLRTRRRLSLGLAGKRMIGNSNAMRQVFDRIDLVRQADSNVVIRGETGTGKELVAYAIHNNSARARSPFVKINCGAIPKDLLESELFGHEKGAFTGALQQRIGFFETADRGTILLDEIGDMPLDLQVKLLGVLQDRVVKRVGGRDQIVVDVRVLAATHQDLEKAVAENRFRQDLYYRLNVVSISVPPLRDRREDIPLLVEHFIGVSSRAAGRAVPQVTPEALQLLVAYDYPGNVRELENIIESSVVMCRNGKVDAADLPTAVQSATGRAVGNVRFSPGMSLDEMERICLIETLRHTEGNKTRAAALLGISARSVHNKLERYRITKELIEETAPEAVSGRT